MDFWFGRAAVFANLLIYIVIRAPHGRRSHSATVTDDRKGTLEVLLLIGATLGTLVLPLVWTFSGFPAAADYELHPAAFATGLLIMAVGHWLFYRSHADLGTNWSVTLQLRESHQMVTSGIYSRIRHPMYSAMFLQGIGQLLFLPNWMIGPAWLLGFGAVYVFRVGHEEAMMRDRFGAEYDAYIKTTGRLLPRLR